MSDPVAALDALLTAAGHPATHTLDADAHFDEDCALFEPLARRGWLLQFDAEGAFHLPGAHARLIESLLAIAGCAPPPTVRDTWIPEAGWLFEIWDDTRYCAHHHAEADAEPSDYFESSLVKSIVDAWLAPDRVLLDFITDDQAAALCLLPAAVVDALVDAEILDLDREEDFCPNPTELVVDSGEALEEYLEDVVSLSREEAAALRAQG